MRNPDHTRRIVITGIGVVSPIGNDVAAVWQALQEGRSGLRTITRFDPAPYTHQVAGEVKDFTASDWMDAKAARRGEPAMHFGVAAAKQALTDSGFEITDANREEVGVVFGSGAGGQNLMIENFATLRDRGHDRVAPTFIANGLVDSTSGMISIETGAIGHNIAVVTACSTGTNSIGEGAEVIKRGDATMVIAGSTEMPLMEVAHAGFGNMRGLGSPLPGAGPESVSRPFDASRDGFVLGEGAGAVILEDLELAKARGARILAELVGYGATADGWDMIQPIDGGTGAARSIRRALERGRVPLDQVDLINPHGTSTPVGDRREAEAFASVFGAGVSGIDISATKSMTGHMMGAAGAFEAVATILSIQHGIIPGTINHHEMDEAIAATGIRVATETKRREIRYAVSNNIGLGGHNGAIVLKRYTGD